MLVSLSNYISRSLTRWLAHMLFACAPLLVLVSCTPNVQQPEVPAIASPTSTPTPITENLITLHYNERPPYLVTTDKGVGGLTGDPATLIFEKSNIPFVWKQTPSKRQIYLLQQNSGRDCLPGWFKNAEREEFAKYTLPIYQDQPQMALMRADNDKISALSTLDEIFANPELGMLVKDGYSYGDFIDAVIAEANPHRVVTTNENSGMLKMIMAGHADYFLIAPEEAEGLIRTSEFDLQDFKFVHFTDIPSGEKRYILCSHQVEDAIIEKLNAAIRQYVTLPPQ